MSEAVQDDESRSWHKRFAIECNNRAWELSVQPRTLLQDREMLDSAHASAWHWDKVGSELNRMRAVTLLAEVHALLGLGASALSFAQTMSDYFARRDSEPWERAVTSAVEAHAAHAAGDRARHHAAHARAAAALAAIDNDEDRAIVVRTFAQVPAP